MIVQTIEEKDVTPEYTSVGRVVACDTVSFRARVSGILERLNFVDGLTVKEGQVLLELEKALIRLWLISEKPNSLVPS